MIVLSLLLSLALLRIANRQVLRAENPAPRVFLTGLGFAFGPQLWCMFFPAVAVQAGLMWVLAVAWGGSHWNRRRYLPISIVITLIVYSVPLGFSIEKRMEWAKIQKEFPFETMVNRLPPRPATNTLWTSNDEHLNAMEKKVFSALHNRNYALRELHEMSVVAFVNTPGFGVGRVYTPHFESLQKSLQNFLPLRPPVRQPDYLNPFILPSNNLQAALLDWDSGKMLSLHDNGVLDFLNPKGFGFAKDREHVAGFQKHGMTKVPEATTSWSVAHLELVGLVVHEKPVVYVTANLPQMDEVQDAPTRPLDFFELDGLDALRKGEDLFYRGVEDKGRMMGSIRAVEQCLKCHGGNRGDLLGAFSYVLRREKTQP